MSKNYFVGLGIGLMILLVVSTLSYHGNLITGKATTEPAVITVQIVESPPKETVTFSGNEYTFKDTQGNVIESFSDPGGVLLTRGTQPVSYDPTRRIVLVGTTRYKVDGSGSTWTQLTADDTPVKIYESILNGVRVTTYQNGEPQQTQILNRNRQPLASNVNPTLARELQVNEQGKLIYSDQELTTTSEYSGGFTFTDSDGDKGYLIPSPDGLIVAQNGDVIVKNADGEEVPGFRSISFDSTNTITGGGIAFNNLDGESIVIRGGNIVYLSTSGTTQEITQDGVTTTKRSTADGPVTSISVEYFNGDSGEGRLDDKGNLEYIARYNEDNLLSQIITTSGVVYNLAADGETWTDASGKKITITDAIKDSTVLARVQSDVLVNNVFNARTDVQKAVKDTASFYRSLRLVNTLWLDKWSGLNNWKSQVDAFIAKNYLNTESFISNICDQWIDNTNSPSNFALGVSGQPVAHIEGERSDSYEDTNGVPVATPVYRISFYVSKYILIDSEQQSSFTLRLYPGSVALPDYETVTIGKDITSVYALGNGMIIKKGGSYDKVCLEFPDQFIFDGTFRNYLRGCPEGAGRLCLCNSLTVTQIPDIGVGEGAARAFGGGAPSQGG